MVVSDFSSDLDLFCHVIQSQAALACASCARSLGSGNRCPGVLWSGVLVLLLPSFSSLSSMARKLINFQSCTILLVAFLGKCQVFGLKISFKKAIGSSSYSSITRCTQREQNARLHVTSLSSDRKYCKEDNKIKPNM